MSCRCEENHTGGGKGTGQWRVTNYSVYQSPREASQLWLEELVKRRLYNPCFLSQNSKTQQKSYKKKFTRKTLVFPSPLCKYVTLKSKRKKKYNFLFRDGTQEGSEWEGKSILSSQLTADLQREVPWTEDNGRNNPHSTFFFGWCIFDSPAICERSGGKNTIMAILDAVCSVIHVAVDNCHSLLISHHWKAPRLHKFSLLP